MNNFIKNFINKHHIGEEIEKEKLKDERFHHLKSLSRFFLDNYENRRDLNFKDIINSFEKKLGLNSAIPINLIRLEAKQMNEKILFNKHLRESKSVFNSIPRVNCRLNLQKTSLNTTKGIHPNFFSPLINRTDKSRSIDFQNNQSFHIKFNKKGNISKDSLTHKTHPNKQFIINELRKNNSHAKKFKLSITPQTNNKLKKIDRIPFNLFRNWKND